MLLKTIMINKKLNQLRAHFESNGLSLWFESFSDLTCLRFTQCNKFKNITWANWWQNALAFTQFLLFITYTSVFVLYTKSSKDSRAIQRTGNISWWTEELAWLEWSQYALGKLNWRFNWYFYTTNTHSCRFWRHWPKTMISLCGGGKGNISNQ